MKSSSQMLYNVNVDLFINLWEMEKKGKDWEMAEKKIEAEEWREILQNYFLSIKYIN